MTRESGRGGVRRLPGRPGILALAALVLSAACAPARGPLNARELAAARAWEPARWAPGKATALIVMDMQKANMPIVGQERVVAAIRALVAAARTAGSPVVWVYSNDEDARPGEERFELVPPFAPAPGEITVVKTSPSAFAGTGLGETLEGLGVGRVVICGVSSAECVQATVEAAYFDGWLTVVAEDAHSVPVRGGSASPIESMNARWAADRRVALQASANIRFDGRP